MLDDLDHHAVTSDDPSRAAVVLQVGGLPLFVALEGKNRVAGYRRLGRSMWVRVRRSEYDLGQKPLGATDAVESVAYEIGALDDSYAIRSVYRLANESLKRGSRSRVLIDKAIADLAIAAGAQEGPPLSQADASALRRDRARLIDEYLVPSMPMRP